MSLIRAVLSALTWRKILVMLAVGYSMPLIGLAEGSSMRVARVLAVGLCAIGNLLVALCADETVKRGVRLRRLYPLALLSVLLVNYAIAAIAHFVVGFGPVNVQPTRQWLGLLAFGIDSSLWGSFAVFVYVNSRITERMAQGVREVEMRRLRLETELVESRLAAAQAQVSPQMLLGALAEVRRKLSVDAPDADEQLAALIQRLRRALAQTAIASELEGAKL
jgi:hypothetical protein